MLFYLQVCLAAVGLVGDLCRALQSNILPFCDEVMQLLLENLGVSVYLLISRLVTVGLHAEKKVGGGRSRSVRHALKISCLTTILLFEWNPDLLGGRIYISNKHLHLLAPPPLNKRV